MHWILQQDIFKEAEWENMVAALDRFDLPYTIHKVIPFIGELVPPAEPTQDKVICIGSYSMRHSAKAAAWSPGVYDLFDMDFTVQLQHWGKHLLNADAEVKEFKDVKLVGPTFVRPVHDSKYFAGKVFLPEEFEEWRHKVADLGEDYGNSLRGNTLVQVCPTKNIYAEYRYWIVGGKIATKSLYKRGSKVTYSPETGAHLDAYVMDMIEMWQPHRAFVIDVCESEEGLFIVEINTLNASGFYAADVQRLVIALEELEA